MSPSLHGPMTSRLPPMTRCGSCSVSVPRSPLARNLALTTSQAPVPEDEPGVQGAKGVGRGVNMSEHDDHGLARPKSVTGIWRVLYVALGLFFVALAVIGVVTPLLPTTPFLLLAAYFFARSSTRLHNWLLRSRLFGGLIRDWQRYRGVRLRVKVVALTMLPIVVFTSAYFGGLPWYLVVMLITLA